MGISENNLEGYDLYVRKLWQKILYIRNVGNSSVILNHFWNWKLLLRRNPAKVNNVMKPVGVSVLISLRRELTLEINSMRMT